MLLTKIFGKSEHYYEKEISARHKLKVTHLRKSSFPKIGFAVPRNLIIQKPDVY